MEKSVSTLEKVNQKISKLKSELERHDVAYAQLEADLALVNGNYTKELIKKHMSLLVNNVIQLKESLEELEKKKQKLT